MDREHVVDSAARLVAQLPLLIDRVETEAVELVLAGTSPQGRAWSLSIFAPWSLETASTAVAWVDDLERSRAVLRTLEGQELLSLEAGEDLFDPTLVFSSGARMRQLSSTDDGEPWVMRIEGREFFVGPTIVDHRHFLASID